MLSTEESEWMERAFALAEEALAADEVPVGCVFVHEGKEIGSGRNRVNETRDPTRHAEMVALYKMEQDIPNFKEILPSLSLFVSLEPCIMCASGLYQLGIRRIVYGADNERFGGIRSVGCAEKYNEQPNIEIVSGIQAERSVALLRAFYDKQNPFAPDDKRKVKKPKEKDEE